VNIASQDSNTITALNTPYLFYPAFGNNLLRIKFGLKGEEAIGGWRELNSEEIHHLYS
jgi:hypothetical protein